MIYSKDDQKMNIKIFFLIFSNFVCLYVRFILDFFTHEDHKQVKADNVNSKI